MATTDRQPTSELCRSRPLGSALAGQNDRFRQFGYGLLGDCNEKCFLSAHHAHSSIGRKYRLCSRRLPGWATTRAPCGCGTNGSPAVRLRRYQALGWKYVPVVRLAEHVSEPICSRAAKPLLDRAATVRKLFKLSLHGAGS